MTKRKRFFGLMAGLMLAWVLSSPLAAAEQTFELTIPGCST